MQFYNSIVCFKTATCTQTLPCVGFVADSLPLDCSVPLSAHVRQQSSVISDWTVNESGWNADACRLSRSDRTASPSGW